jgi:hypothetical protein
MARKRKTGRARNVSEKGRKPDKPVAGKKVNPRPKTEPARAPKVDIGPPGSRDTW